jgi:hypothetical protein
MRSKRTTESSTDPAEKPVEKAPESGGGARFSGLFHALNRVLCNSDKLFVLSGLTNSLSFGKEAGRRGVEVFHKIAG